MESSGRYMYIYIYIYTLVIVCRPPQFELYLRSACAVFSLKLTTAMQTAIAYVIGQSANAQHAAGMAEKHEGQQGQSSCGGLILLCTT